jgi:taurine dioxygenase
LVQPNSQCREQYHAWKPLTNRIPEYQVRWRWRRNDVAFWDNRATQHYAVMDYPPCHRKMERAGIKGEATF